MSCSTGETKRRPIRASYYRRERDKRRSRRRSIYTCKLRDSPPAAEAMSVDEGDKLLVFFRCPWPFLQSYLIAARFSPHPSKLLTPSFLSCCFFSLRDLPPSLSLLTDLDLSQRTALILSLKEVERVFFFPGLATRLQKINRKKLDLTKESINQVRFYLINRSSFQDCFSQYKFLNPATAVQEIALPFKSTKMPFELQTINWKGQKKEKKLQILAHL
jgi:hypothetical protein